MDCSPPGSSVHGFPRQEYWSGLPLPPLRESSQPRDRTCVSRVSCTGRCILYHCITWEAPLVGKEGSKCMNKSSQLPCSLGTTLLIRKPHLHATVCFKNTTYPIRSQDIFCFFIFVVGLNFKWISTTAVLLKQGYCFWGSCRWLLTGWNGWGTRLFHELKFLDIKKRNEPDSFLQQQQNSSTETWVWANSRI